MLSFLIIPTERTVSSFTGAVSGCCWIPELDSSVKNASETARRLCTPPVTDRASLFTALHELGHLQDLTICSYYEDILEHEILAWQYALRCLKPEVHDELIRYALPCLETYTDPWAVSRKTLEERLRNVNF